MLTVREQQLFTSLNHVASPSRTVATLLNHDCRMNLAAIPAFASGDTFHVVVECPRGSNLKLKYVEKWQTMTVSRPLASGLAFPFDWGFIPSTEMPDGDPLDAMLVWDVTACAGVVVECRAIGVLQVAQNRDNHDPSRRVRNDRVLAVPIQAPRQQTLTSYADLGERLLREFEQFAIASTALEGKDVEIVGWGDVRTTIQLIRDHLSPSPHTNSQSSRS